MNAMTEKLKEAFEKQKEVLERIESSPEQKDLRPEFHLASPCGWINDPNGFSYFKGMIHLFFQYHPYGNKWGPMHWGHAVSKDFMHWEFVMPALAPDCKLDADGCFSGTAIEDNGKHIIIYTGVIDGNRIQNQSLAIGDGETYEKIFSNPIITAKDIPFEIDRAHFRDPKIWKENGKFYVAAVVKTTDGSGAIVLFESEDLAKWDFLSVIDRSNRSLGMMWECPDVFSLDGTDVIIVSPQEMEEDLEKGWHKGNNSCCIIGKLSRETWKFERTSARQIDFGIDFYAPQTMFHPDGRRIMVAWMHNWENFSTPENYLWTGMMTFPRELSVKEGHLFQQPVKEIELLRKQSVKQKLKLESGKMNSANEIQGRHFDMIFRFEESSKIPSCLELSFAKGAEFETKLSFDFDACQITFDRSRSGTRTDCESVRKFRYEMPVDRKFDFRLLCDINSAELFVCNGRYAFTNVFYANPECDEISFSASDDCTAICEFYSLK